jgi:hypothetical protein
VRVAMVIFGLGNFTVWFGFSAIAAPVQWGLLERAWLSSAMRQDDAESGCSSSSSASARRLPTRTSAA